MRRTRIWLVGAMLAAARPAEVKPTAPAYDAVFSAELTPDVFAELQLRPFLDWLTQPITGCDSRLLMLYSLQCPHCRVFAPLWQEIARQVHQCEAAKEFGAFECTQSENRSLPKQDLAPWNVPQLPDLVAPFDICQSLSIGYYPQLVVVSKPGCLSDSAKEHMNAVNNSLLNADEFELFELTSLNKESIFQALEQLQEMQLVQECARSSLSSISESEILSVLDTVEVAQGRKWDSATPSLEDREHDAIVGAYRILSNWVVSSKIETFTERHVQVLNQALHFVAYLFELPEANYTDVKKAVVVGSGPHQYATAVQNLRIRDVPLDAAARTCTAPTCVIWQFFHYSAAVLYSRASEGASATTLASLSSLRAQDFPAFVVPPVEVANFYRDLVELFFSCLTCKQHFAYMVDNDFGDLSAWVAKGDVPLQIANGTSPLVKQTTGFVLWLWRVHNIVNVRTNLVKVANALALRAANPNAAPSEAFGLINTDVRYPATDACAKCWLKPNATKIDKHMIQSYIDANFVDYDLEYDFVSDFNLDVVFSHIQNEYLTISGSARALVPMSNKLRIPEMPKFVYLEPVAPENWPPKEEKKVIVNDNGSLLVSGVHPRPSYKGATTDTKNPGSSYGFTDCFVAASVGMVIFSLIYVVCSYAYAALRMHKFQPLEH